MNVAYFHGLESTSPSDKSRYLEKTFSTAYSPLMDYKKSETFDNVLAEVKSRKIDFLIGSSMGGWFAYCISTLTGIPTLLFNPGLQGRSIDPHVLLGTRKSNHTVIFGKSDKVIDPYKSIEWIEKNGIGQFTTHFENNGHRTPIEVFRKWVRKCVLNEHEHSQILSFNEFLNENNIK